MERDGYLTVDKRARITKIQDSLIDRYVEQKEALQEGDRCRAIALQFEIKELLREKEESQAMGGTLIGLSNDRPISSV